MPCLKQNFRIPTSISAIRSLSSAGQSLISDKKRLVCFRHTVPYRSSKASISIMVSIAPSISMRRPHTCHNLAEHLCFRIRMLYSSHQVQSTVTSQQSVTRNRTTSRPAKTIAQNPPFDAFRDDERTEDPRMRSGSQSSKRSPQLVAFAFFVLSWHRSPAIPYRNFVISSARRSTNLISWIGTVKIACLQLLCRSSCRRCFAVIRQSALNQRKSTAIQVIQTV